MMVSKVRGKFNSFDGEFVTGENPSTRSVTATIDLSSIDTGNADRDNHIRSADFFDVDHHQAMTYRSTGVRAARRRLRPRRRAHPEGRHQAADARPRAGRLRPRPLRRRAAGFTAVGEIKRSDFGVDFNAVLETGGVVVGDKVTLILEIEGVLQK